MIVEHYTVTSTFAPVFSLFSRNVPDQELHELPGICSHFVIDRDGTIYRLVQADDHVPPHRRPELHGDRHRARGQSDAQVMGDRRQLAASLRLTRALQGRYGIATRNVIGHNESLSSPYHRENVRAPPHADARRLPEARRWTATGACSVDCRPRRASGRLPAVEKRQIAGVALAAVGIGFAAVNLDEVKVNWILGTWRTPLIVVIALSIVIGAGLGLLIARGRRSG